MSGEIPQSSALGEAKADSISDLLSRDPMGHSRVDRERAVEELRARRKGWEAVENAGGHKKGAKKAGVGKVATEALDL